MGVEMKNKAKQSQFSRNAMLGFPMPTCLPRPVSYRAKRSVVEISPHRPDAPLIHDQIPPLQPASSRPPVGMTGVSARDSRSAAHMNRTLRPRPGHYWMDISGLLGVRSAAVQPRIPSETDWWGASRAVD